MNDKIQNSTVDLLKRISSDERKLFSMLIQNNFKKYLDLKKGIKSILFVYNSNFEPNIEPIIQMCNELKIECHCYCIIRKKEDITQIDFNNQQMQFFKYTKLPYYDNTESSFKKEFDLVFFPIMAFNSNKECIDYEFKINYVRIMNLPPKTIKCAYCFSIQEYFDLDQCRNKFLVDNIITELIII